MDHAQVFFQSILNDPRDDTARLIYADWLEEQDKPLGKLIHLQYAIENGPRGRARRDLRRRIKILLDAHENDWMSPLKRFVTRWGFRRGFVEEIELTGTNFIQHAEQLFKIAPIRHVRLTGLRDTERVRELAACPYLSHIEWLDLTQSDIQLCSDIATLLASPHLSRLAALTVPLRLPSAASWEILTSPRTQELRLHLDLQVDQREGASRFRQLPELPRLQSLTVRGYRLADEVLPLLCRGANLPHITDLRLDQSSIGLAGIQSLASTRRLRRLQSLNLSHSSPGPRGIALLQESPTLRKLRKLSLNDASLWEEDAQALFAGKAFPLLRHLDLGGNRIGTEGARLLTQSGQTATLRSLSLASNGIGPTGAEILGQADSLSRLRRLNLDNNRLGDRGVRLLLASGAMPRLRELSLYLNGLGSLAGEAIARSPSVSRLSCLNLNGNRLAERGIIAMARSPYLTNLHKLQINGSTLTAEAVEALIESPTLKNLKDIRHQGHLDIPEDLRQRMRDRFFPFRIV